MLGKTHVSFVEVHSLESGPLSMGHVHAVARAWVFIFELDIL